MNIDDELKRVENLGKAISLTNRLLNQQYGLYQKLRGNPGSITQKEMQALKERANTLREINRTELSSREKNLKAQQKRMLEKLYQPKNRYLGVSDPEKLEGQKKEQYYRFWEKNESVNSNLRKIRGLREKIYESTSSFKGFGLKETLDKKEKAKRDAEDKKKQDLEISKYSKYFKDPGTQVRKNAAGYFEEYGYKDVAKKDQQDIINNQKEEQKLKNKNIKESAAADKRIASEREKLLSLNEDLLDNEYKERFKVLAKEQENADLERVRLNDLMDSLDDKEAENRYKDQWKELQQGQQQSKFSKFLGGIGGAGGMVGKGAKFAGIAAGGPIAIAGLLAGVALNKAAGVAADAVSWKMETLRKGIRLAGSLGSSESTVSLGMRKAYMDENEAINARQAMISSGYGSANDNRFINMARFAKGYGLDTADSLGSLSRIAAASGMKERNKDITPELLSGIITRGLNKSDMEVVLKALEGSITQLNNVMPYVSNQQKAAIVGMEGALIQQGVSMEAIPGLIGKAVESGMKPKTGISNFAGLMASGFFKGQKGMLDTANKLKIDDKQRATLIDKINKASSPLEFAKIAQLMREYAPDQMTREMFNKLPEIFGDEFTKGNSLFLGDQILQGNLSQQIEIKKSLDSLRSVIGKIPKTGDGGGAAFSEFAKSTEAFAQSVLLFEKLIKNELGTSMVKAMQATMGPFLDSIFNNGDKDNQRRYGKGFSGMVRQTADNLLPGDQSLKIGGIPSNEFLKRFDTGEDLKVSSVTELSGMIAAIENSRTFAPQKVESLQNLHLVLNDLPERFEKILNKAIETAKENVIRGISGKDSKSLTVIERRAHGSDSRNTK
jgi:hypothetical protein